MISAALDIQGELAQQSQGESSTVSVPGSRTISVPGTKTLTPVASQNPNKKKVLFVTSEIADLVKTGGLGDVSAALPMQAVRVARDGHVGKLDAAPDQIARFRACSGSRR